MSHSVRHFVGIDEVGRGPLAGPICVGACLTSLSKKQAFLAKLAGIKDSKQLTPEAREEWVRILAQAAKKGECRFVTVFISEKVIDTKGLSYALHRAIGQALKRLKVKPNDCRVLLDGGIKAPKAFMLQETIIKGDEKEPLIAGASIVAKVRRDKYMTRLGKRYPSYGFEQHKGYGTKKHYEALKKHGISPFHRMSFLGKFLLREDVPIPVLE